MGTTKNDMIDVQILMDTVRGHFRGKTAFMGSLLVSSGAVRVSGTMPEGGSNAIGKTIDIPYFGVLGEFVSNPDGSAVTPSKIGQTSEQATIERLSLAAEVSRWAAGVGALMPGSDTDPYEEAKRQIAAAAERAMDSRMVTAFGGTPLVYDVHSSSVPVYLTWDLAQEAMALWGDEQDGLTAMVMHSQARKDVAKLKDSSGRPLLLGSQADGQQQLTRFAGVPVVASDRTELTGSTMGAVTAAGTTPPTVTLSGTPLGAFKLFIDVVTGGAAGTATFRFSTDGGQTWSATYLIPNGGGAVVLDDSISSALADIAGARPADSLVGINGKTGVTATFASGTYNADNTYKSCANLKCTTLIAQQDAGGFWYNAARLGIKQDEDILADTDIAASHLYHAAKLYRRRRGGSRPGVVAIRHNVSGYIGQVNF